jgi:S-adenosylmethionine:tRNA ribosyltransferase-isomerase
MRAAPERRSAREPSRLLAIDPASGAYGDGSAVGLPSLLRRGDLVVVNDAATLPSAFVGSTSRGEPIEARLTAPIDDDGAALVVLFGDGDHRTPTEDRPLAPRLFVGDTQRFGGRLFADVVAPLSRRLARVRFRTARTASPAYPEGDPNAFRAALFAAVYAAGRPVQYAHVPRALALWDVQTAYASVPWAVEAPSAGFFVSASTLRELARRGVDVAFVTHAAGLSTTGDLALDQALLPLPERSRIPERTAEAIARAKRAGGRVVGVGTTVVRALEGAADASGRVVAGERIVALRLSREETPRIVDGLVTGMHAPGTSHRALLEAFAPPALLDAAYAHAAEAGYLAHEFGDGAVILPGLVAPRIVAA